MAEGLEEKLRGGDVCCNGAGRGGGGFSRGGVGFEDEESAESGEEDVVWVGEVGDQGGHGVGLMGWRRRGSIVAVGKGMDRKERAHSGFDFGASDLQGNEFEGRGRLGYCGDCWCGVREAGELHCLCV